MKKNVNLKINATQYSETLQPSGSAYVRKMEEEDSVEILTEGVMYEKNNARYITYEDASESGLDDVRTVYKLSDGKLRIRRYGKNDDEEEMDLVLQPGMMNITKFQSPISSYLSLEIYTNSLENKLNSDGYGEIAVDYRIKINDVYSRRNILKIEVSS